ncbi:MAG: DUF5667 domain-containing protein [Patescibacteria group bacterium]
MDDKELFKKLNNFKNILPDNEWKNSCREILLSQISCGQTVEELEQKKQFDWKIFFGDLLPQWNKIEMARPIWAGVFVMVLLIICGLTSVYASKDTKPGDSLYIAKIINEKAKFAITFDEKEKTKLNLEFAINRAKEINQLLEKITVVELDKNEKAQKLTFNFKKEINQAKIRLNKMNDVNNNQTAEESRFSAANINKNNQRIEISEPIKSELIKTNNNSSVASKPQDVVETATATVENLIKNDPQTTNEILNEAEKLFNEKKISESIDKINESIDKLNVVAQIIDNNESASTTINN